MEADWLLTVVTMTVRTEAGIVTAAMAVALPLPNGLQTATYIIPIARLPAQPVLHPFTRANRDMADISTAMATERRVNETSMQALLVAMMFNGAE